MPNPFEDEADDEALELSDEDMVEGGQAAAGDLAMLDEAEMLDLMRDDLDE